MYLPKNQDLINFNRKKGKKRELNFIEHHNIIVLSKNVKQLYKGDVLQGKTYTTDPISHKKCKSKKSVEASRLAFSVVFFEI